MNNVAASVRARLLNVAKAQGVDFNQVLVRFALERILYRLSQSEHADHYLLKGALLFTLWYDMPHRTTRDADLLGFGTSDLESVAQTFRDIAFGDAVTPGPVDATYPVLLADLPAPRLRTYPVYTVVAEKLHAIALLGMTNSRLKDYLDLSVLLDREALDTDLLAQAIKATFERRGMAVPAGLPVGLTDEFAHDPSRQALWQAFIKKNELALEPLPTIVDRLRVALGAALNRAAA
jgi:hypothetical protein